MAAITITTNIKGVLSNIRSGLEKLKDKDYLLRPVATEIIPMMKDRIHIRGEGSDGTPIGTYSNSYLKYRMNHKRGSDTKVIVSMTRQLENDWSVIATDKGYGIGFNNSFNAQKARWVEETKDKVIFDLAEEEKNYSQDRLQELITNAFNS